MICGGTCDAYDTPEFDACDKPTFTLLPLPFLNALPPRLLFLLKCGRVSLYWDFSVPLSAEFWGTWTFCSSRERIYDDLLGETKGLIQ